MVVKNERGTFYYNELEEYHREDGPAAIWNIGVKIWWINNEKHREDGPAVEYDDGTKVWYLNDIRYTEEEYHQELIKIKLERLKNL